jgi:leucyl aminopeptidase (aminopeptidase T)
MVAASTGTDGHLDSRMIPAMPDLGPAVQTTLSRCLAVARGEDVLVIVDPKTLPIGEALRDGARKLGAEATLAIMDERPTHGAEPPRTIAAALLECDVFIAPTTKSLSHTAARKRATDGGARGATMPGVTKDMLARVMAGDFETMVTRSRAVGTLLDAGAQARITCPRGTDVTLELTGRRGLADDGVLAEAHAFGNLPAGEGFIAPLTGTGTIVASSLAGLGISEDPARLTMEDGQLIAARDGAGPELLAQLQAHGTLGTNLAELGVGTNDAAILTGNVLEDEKILGTVHIAFGASAGIGGTVSVPIHLDVVVLEASLEIDGRRVLDAGRYVLDA